jgi:hypothetical protein
MCHVVLPHYLLLPLHTNHTRLPHFDSPLRIVRRYAIRRVTNKWGEQVFCNGGRIKRVDRYYHSYMHRSSLFMPSILVVVVRIKRDTVLFIKLICQCRRKVFMHIKLITTDVVPQASALISTEYDKCYLCSMCLFTSKQKLFHRHVFTKHITISSYSYRKQY